MKKNLSIIIFSILFGSVFAVSVSAAIVSFSSSTINAKSGQELSALIYIDPQGKAIYTAKIQLDFPKNLINIDEFRFAPNWMPLSQSGYDLADNINGVMVKSAGYPGGISNSVLVGSAKFVAKATGRGVINLSDKSFVLDANGQNILTGNPQMSLVVNGAVSAPVTLPATVSPEPSPIITPEPIQPNIEQVSQTIAPQSQASIMSAFSNILTLGTNKVWIGALSIVLVLLLLSIVYMLSTGFWKKEEV